MSERVIELSCDLGEAQDPLAERIEAELWPLVHAANVACGGHVGDEESMLRAVLRARDLGVILGAHPSYPDRDGFGRRTIAMPLEALRASVRSQIESLRRVAESEGVKLRRVKPHGALYNDAHRDGALAAAVVDAVAEVDPGLALVAAPGSQLLESAAARGLTCVAEAFADRRYRADGSLVPRSEPGSLLLDPEEAAEQALRLAHDGEVIASSGERTAIAFDTVCIHGDMENAVERLRAIRRRI